MEEEARTALEASEEVKQKIILEEDENEYWNNQNSPNKPDSYSKTLTNRDLKTFGSIDPMSPMSATRASYKKGPTSVSSGSYMSAQRYEVQQTSGENTTIVKQKTRRKKNTVVQKKKIVLK